MTVDQILHSPLWATVKEYALMGTGPEFVVNAQEPFQVDRSIY